MATTDLISSTPAPYGLRLEGLGDVERTPDKRLYRWGMGPQSVMVFKAPMDQKVTLTCAFENTTLAGQGVTLLVNGKQLARAENLAKGPAMTLWEVPVQLREGENLIDRLLPELP